MANPLSAPPTLPPPKVPSKLAPKPSGKNIGPLKGGIGPLPMPRAAPRAAPPKASPLKAGIPKPLEGAPKLAKAYKKAPFEPYKAPKGGGGLLGGVGKFLVGAAPNLLGEMAGVGGGPVAKAIVKAGTPKAEATAKVFAKEPGGLTSRTLTEIPKTLNAMVVGPGRTLTEEGLAAAHSKFPGIVPAHVFGTQVGPPGEALKSMAKTIAGEYVGPNARYGKSMKAEEEALKHRGLTPELTDMTLAVGVPGGAALRGASKLAAESSRGAEAAAKVDAFREARTHALQAPSVQEFLRRQDQIPVKPTRAERRRAFIHESTQARPNLRQAPGREPPKLERGAAVVKQPRGANLLRGMGQTALDNARRSRMQDSLQRVMDARTKAATEPHLSQDLLPQSFASQLAFDTRRGEVTPLLQRGGLARGKFIGAEQAQRIGAAYGKGENVRERRGIADAYGHTYNELIKQATPEQKKILVYAKEGHLPLNDPKAAAGWLQEIHDQAVQGRGDLTIPLQHVRSGSDVARETGAILDHIGKHGPESVFTPKFAKLVEMMPDERLVSPRDPVLQQNPDAAIARKYLPQQHMLAQWAERHPDHPDAPATAAGVQHIHQLLEEGHDLRQEALAHSGANASIHDKATDKFATAKNLADELATIHGLPTDRAYVQHTQTMDKANWLHTVANTSPADYKRWQGLLQKAGYRATGPELVLRAIQKSLRNEFSQRNVNSFEQRFGVQLPRSDMTAQEVHNWLADSGRNPDHFQVMHLGKLRAELADQASADHLLHLNSDPEAHARTLEQAWARAGDTPLTDTTKGASLVPKAAFEEMRNSFQQAGFLARGFGKGKGEISKLMLGLSLPWATTMGAVTYPLQSLMGGAGPFDFLSHVRYYRSLSNTDKAAFDQAFGVDNPFRLTSHGLDAERMGSALPRNLDGLSQSLKVMRQSPMGRLLSKANPVRALIAAERIPRRYSRINVATKGLKNEAIKQMLEEMHGGQVAQNSFEMHVQKLMHTGRLPASEYMDKAMGHQPAVEAIAQHAINAMGEWHNMTNFERNTLNKYVMFYPWLRYSLKLAAHTLPAHHPLLYAAALKLGTWEHKNLVELLGTEPEPGNVYLGKAQPNVKPEKRKFAEFGIKQANPTINTAMSAIAGSPNELFDVLPPYLTSALGWAVNRNLFTGKPLRGATLAESKEIKGRPAPLGYFLHENVESPLSPLRTAGNIITGGRPQSAESAPAFGMEKPAEYSNKTERKIAKEVAERRKEGLFQQLLKEQIPLVPHAATKLPLKLELEKREGKEEKKMARKQRHRDEKEARKEKTGPKVSSQFLP